MNQVESTWLNTEITFGDRLIEPELPEIADGNYIVRIAQTREEIESSFRLRHRVFDVEFGSRKAEAIDTELEFDAYDLKCRHLIVVSRASGETVGTYRLNSIETAHSIHGFYSANEFTIEDLPADVLNDGIEIGRASIAREHRNTKVLFLLWKALLVYQRNCGRRYFFGCCSIFSQDTELGRRAFRQLNRDGHLHERFSVMPCQNGLSVAGDDVDDTKVELPSLFNMYLRIGAKVCGPPMIDREFGTIDFFVVFDVTEMSAKYRKMFLS